MAQQQPPRVVVAGYPPHPQPSYPQASQLPQGYGVEGYGAPQMLYGLQSAQLAAHMPPRYAHAHAQQAWLTQGYAPQQPYAHAPSAHRAPPAAPVTDVDMCSSTERAMVRVEDQLSVRRAFQTACLEGRASVHATRMTRMIRMTRMTRMG